VHGKCDGRRRNWCFENSKNNDFIAENGWDMSQGVYAVKRIDFGDKSAQRSVISEWFHLVGKVHAKYATDVER